MGPLVAFGTSKRTKSSIALLTPGSKTQIPLALRDLSLAPNKAKRQKFVLAAQVTAKAGRFK